jgi:hypothetical protein
MGILAYILLHMIRPFYVWGEEVRRSMDWRIKRLIKAGAKVSYHARRWYVHVASAFPLAHHCRSPGLGSIGRESMGYRLTDGVVCPKAYAFLDFTRYVIIFNNQDVLPTRMGAFLRLNLG